MNNKYNNSFRSKLYKGVKYIIIIAVCGLSIILLNCQKSKKDSNKNNMQTKNINPKYVEEYAIQEKIYKMGIKYNDFDMAIYALSKMMVLNPYYTSLKDSLAIVYFKSGSHFIQCILVSNEILENKPDNQIILEIKALCEVNLALYKDATDDYENLYKQSGNILHLYHLAFSQYKLKRFPECNLSIDKILSDTDIDNKSVNITTAEGSRQNVPLKAAALNIKAVMFMENQQYDTAKKYISEALEIFPDFELAKANLQFVENKIKGE